MNKTLKKNLIRIAHSYGVRCHFPKGLVIPYAYANRNLICIADHDEKERLIISEFFHELGHVMDYRNKVYPGYYKNKPTKKYLKRYAIRAEIHTDLTGKKLMSKHFPDMKFVYTYKYKKWQKFAKMWWKIS